MMKEKGFKKFYSIFIFIIIILILDFLSLASLVLLGFGNFLRQTL